MCPRIEQLCNAWKSMEKLFVKVDEEKLDELAWNLSNEMPETPDWQIPGVLPKNDHVFVNHVFYECAVDFCFRHFEAPYDKYEVDGITGSKAMGRCFYRRFGERPIQVEEILEITSSIEKTREFFQGKNLPPLLEERRANLQEVAQVLKEYFRGDPLFFLEASRYQVSDFWIRSNPGIVYLLEKYFPTAFGQDRAFQKRANLFPLMYQARALHSEGELTLLRDPENIGPVIDYNIPNTFRDRDVMGYSEELSGKIDNRQIIPKDSEEEFEIRSAAYYCIVELLSRINKNIRHETNHWSMIELDYKIYSAKSRFHHHLTPTTDY